MSDIINRFTAHFAPISLAEVNQRASLQTRADNKYMVKADAFMAFAEALAPNHAVMEIGGRRAFSYDTQYFDTADLASYWGHVQKRRKRFKCRSRIYVGSDLCVFELKLKSGRGETIKHKIGYTEDASKEVNPAATEFLRKQLGEAYGMDMLEPMVPTLHNQYQRVTLVALDSAERITCDFNLNFGDESGWHGRMDDDCVLIEIKSARGRGAADQLLWRLGQRPSGGSKYCIGLSLVRPNLRYNPFAYTRKNFFSRIGESVITPAPVGLPVSMPTPVAAALPLATAASSLTVMPSATVAMLE